MLTDGWTAGRTHGRTNDRRKVITIAHPEQSSGELKMSRVYISIWFSIQDIILNMTSSVWFRIQRIIKKYLGYYSAYGSVFRVFFKIRPAASGSGFSVLLKNVQDIIQRMVQYSGYYSKYDLQR